MSLKTLNNYSYFSIEDILTTSEINKLPYSIRILLENMIRVHDFNIGNEDDIKNDVKVACKKIVDVFDWLPNNYVDYDEDMKKQKKLSVFDRNNNMFDKRPIHQRVSNLEATTKALQKFDALWMLENE